jgi:hypothetical protein
LVLEERKDAVDENPLSSFSPDSRSESALLDRLTGASPLRNL